VFLFNVPQGRRDVGCLPPDFSSTGISWKYYFPDLFLNLNPAGWRLNVNSQLN